MRPCLLLALLLLTLGTAALAQKRDFSNQYRPERRPLLDTRREGDSLRIYLYLPPGTWQPKQPLRLTAWPAYDSRRPLWTDTAAVRLLPDDQSGTSLSFCLLVSRLQAGTVLSLASAPGPEAATGDAAWLALTAARLARPYLLTDSLGQPLLRRTVRAGEIFGVDRYGVEQVALLRRYNTPFVAAAPPHATARQTSAPAVLRVSDSLMARAGMQLQLPQAGIYTLRLAGEPSTIGLLATEKDYPALTTADDLIQPLIYLTSSAERKKLYDAPNAKRAVDEFWLKAAANQQTLARQAIRTYYGRVAAANELFAAHKAGWMTDRGMLYVVLGPPDAVYRTAQEERWVYHALDNGSAATFTFRPKPSTFAPDNYELVRRPEHERLWYAAVEQWRKATTTAPGR